MLWSDGRWPRPFLVSRSSRSASWCSRSAASLTFPGLPWPANRYMQSYHNRRELFTAHWKLIQGLLAGGPDPLALALLAQRQLLLALCCILDLPRPYMACNISVCNPSQQARRCICSGSPLFCTGRAQRTPQSNDVAVAKYLVPRTEECSTKVFNSAGSSVIADSACGSDTQSPPLTRRGHLAGQCMRQLIAGGLRAVGYDHSSESGRSVR